MFNVKYFYLEWFGFINNKVYFFKIVFYIFWFGLDFVYGFCDCFFGVNI